MLNEKTMVSDALTGVNGEPFWRDDPADREQRTETMPEADPQRV